MSDCLSVDQADAQHQQLLANERQTTPTVVRHWLARHPAHGFRSALIDGSGAAVDFSEIEFTAGLFESYIMTNDLEINLEVARETAQFLQELFGIQ
jgi:hypothetical protein